MCGICGIVGRDASRGLHLMLGALHHRGPDDSGIYEGKGVALGHTRLAIIDTSVGGHQPMANDAKNVWIIYNGEVYNFRDERQQLRERGHGFSTSSDTEVVLKMYEEYGIGFLQRLRGIFALAIYDNRASIPRLILARDPFGIKPLWYAQVNSAFVFGSELKALLASDLVDRRIDPISLRLLLASGSVPQPRSMIAGISMLLPGHFLVLEEGRARIDRYWNLATNRHSELRRADYKEMTAVVRKAIEESVTLQMVSDVPIGAFLSGGIDSTITAVLMARQTSGRIKTFSVGFGDEGAALDESDAAQSIASHIGTDHTRVLVTGEALRDELPQIAKALDQPSVDGANAYFVSQAARQSVTVAISGTGGDELFAGYPWFSEMARFEAGQRNGDIRYHSAVALGVIGRFGLFDGLLGTGLGRALERSRALGGFLPHYSRQYRIFGESGAARMLAPELLASTRLTPRPWELAAWGDELNEANAVERVTALCLRGYTQNQLLRDIDAVSMANSLEVRVPFLDTSMVDIALSLPDWTKVGHATLRGEKVTGSYRNTGIKRILIDAAADLLPADIDLQEKRGFGMPMDSWLRGPLREVLLDRLSPESVARRGLFRATEVQRCLRSFIDGKSSWVYPWLLLVIEIWCAEVLETGG